jgi:signal transduction histidine kinase/ActR/RegA family two-component response regulator
MTANQSAAEMSFQRSAAMNCWADSSFGREQAKWTTRLVSAGSFLTLLFQIIYMTFDRRFLSTAQPLILIFHSLNIGLFGIAVTLALIGGPWMRRHSKAIAFAFSAVMIWSSTAIAILTRETEPLFVMIVLFLAGTGIFLSSGGRIQALLSVFAIAAFALAIHKVSVPIDLYQWLGLSIAAAIGISSAMLLEGLRHARRQAEAEVLKSRETLVRQERMRLVGQLASGIAHDLNNTLNIVRLRLAVLSLDKNVADKHSAQLDVIDRAIGDAAQTVARVRDIGAKREHGPDESVNLFDVIVQAIDLARTSIAGRPALDGTDIQIESNLPPSLPYVEANASELRQVFLNLILNASDAINGKGTITIDAVAGKDSVIISVADDGSGIPEEHLGRIFEPFYTTKGALGTGLGLSIVREIVQGIGGSVIAQNRPDRGAVLKLSLPVAKDSIFHPPTEPLQQTANGCSFLLVDDDAQNLSALGDVLTLTGHRAETVTSGVEAVKKLRSNAVYDAVLCDLGMPGMNGWEVAGQAREIAPNLPFYIVTGWSAQFGEKPPLPVSGVLSKPVRPVEIQRIVASLAAANGGLKGPAKQSQA